MFRTVTALALVLLGARLAAAQTRGSFDDLVKRVKVGDLVRITTSSGNTTTGRVTRLTSGEIVVRAGTSESTFTGSETREVAVRHHRALLGAGVGAIAGAFIPRTTVVYRAGETQVFMSPTLRRQAIGVVAGVRW